MRKGRIAHIIDRIEISIQVNSSILLELIIDVKSKIKMQYFKYHNLEAFASIKNSGSIR